MIYTYHKINKPIQDTTTILPHKFFIDMLGLIGKKVVHLDEYNPNDPKNVALTFDDGTRDFLKYALPILKFFHYPYELCIVEDFVKDKSGYFLNEEDLKNLVKQGARLQYHSKSHKDLTTLQTEEEILQELVCPEELKQLDPDGFKFFIYPFWNYNATTERLATQNGYKAGLSGYNATIVAEEKTQATWFRIRKG